MPTPDVADVDLGSSNSCHEFEYTIKGGAVPLEGGRLGANETEDDRAIF